MAEVISSDEDDILLRDLDMFCFAIAKTSPQKISPSMTNASLSTTPKQIPTEGIDVSPVKSEVSSVVSLHDEQEIDRTNIPNSKPTVLNIESLCTLENEQGEKSCVSNAMEQAVGDDWARYVNISNLLVSSFFCPSTPEKVKENRCYITEENLLSIYKPIQKIVPSGTNEIQSTKNVGNTSLSASPDISIRSTPNTDKIGKENLTTGKPVESSPTKEKNHADMNQLVKTRENVVEELEKKEKEENIERETHQPTKTKGILRRKLQFPEDDSTDPKSKNIEFKEFQQLESNEKKRNSSSVRFAMPVQQQNNDTNSPKKLNSFYEAPIRNSASIPKNRFPHSIPDWNLIRNPMLHESPNFIRVNGLRCVINYIKIICPFGFTTFFRLMKIIVGEDVKVEDNGTRWTNFFIRMSDSRAFEFVVHTDIILPSNLTWNQMKVLSDNSILYIIIVKE